MVLGAGLVGGCGETTSVTQDMAICPSNSTSQTPCCTGGCGSGRICAFNESGESVCLATCKRLVECTTSCCAPVRNRAGDVIGPYACVATQLCCRGGLCADGSCCASDALSNQFCTRGCSDDSTCGAGHCTSYTFPNGCPKPKACGP